MRTATINGTQCEVVIKELWWQSKGLQYTATGYGSKIPTRHMVRFNGKLRRIYCRIFSNIGTLYISSGEIVEICE
jgi:hypothetical protein